MSIPAAARRGPQCTAALVPANGQPQPANGQPQSVMMPPR